MIKLATLFSGIGAIEQALKRLHIDYELVFACDNGEIEIDFDVEKAKEDISKLDSKKAKKEYVDNLYSSLTSKTNYVKLSYLANYDIDKDDFHLDVRLLDGKDYEGQVDLLVGGSPCQSFSSVGFQGGLEDTRGTLFYDYARIIKEVKPKVFIYENVRGLTTHDGGKTWKKIKDVFMNDLHYKITEPQVLNASDFGIPQTRRRLFVIGIREDLTTKAFEYPVGIGTENLPFFVQDLLEDNIDQKSEKDRVILTYEVTKGELSGYQTTNDYIPGKSNPFGEVSKAITEEEPTTTDNSENNNGNYLL